MPMKPLAAAALAVCLAAVMSPARAGMTVAETVNLRPDSARSMCLEFKPKAQIANCDGSNGQKITLSRRDTPAAERIMRVGQQCIEAGREGQTLFLAACRNRQSQTWNYSSDGQIRNGNGLCIDVNNGDTAAGTTVIAYRCTGQTNQRWARFDPAEAVAANADVTTATLRPEIAPDKCLDLTPDGRLVVWTCHGGENQTFAYASRGSARILVNGKCLEAPKNGNGPVRGVSCNVNSAEQLWTAETSGRIQNRKGGCMDVAASATADGTEILRWNCTGNRNQKFKPR
ncbi:MAG: ricin-type beta-trefoil lectin domain protein [Micropepsaceae bacterium]